MGMVGRRRVMDWGPPAKTALTDVDNPHLDDTDSDDVGDGCKASNADTGGSGTASSTCGTATAAPVAAARVNGGRYLTMDSRISPTSSSRISS